MLLRTVYLFTRSLHARAHERRAFIRASRFAWRCNGGIDRQPGREFTASRLFRGRFLGAEPGRLAGTFHLLRGWRQSTLARRRRTLRTPSACWVCRDLQRTWACLTSANPSRVRPWVFGCDRCRGLRSGADQKLKGCHVVGVAGGAKKCCYAVEESGFDESHRHHGVRN